MNSQTLVVKEVVFQTVFFRVSETLYHQSSTIISAIRQEKICDVSGLRGVNDIALAVSFIPPSPSPYLHYPMSKYKEEVHPIRQSYIPFSSLLTSRGVLIVPWGLFELCSSVFGKRLHIQVCLFFLFYSGHSIARFVTTVCSTSHRTSLTMWCAVVHSAGASVCAVCGVCSDSVIRNWHTIDRHQRSPAAQQCNQLLRTHLRPL